MREEKLYIIDSKESSNSLLKKKMQDFNFEYVTDFSAINTILDSKVIYILNDYKDCINLFNTRDYRKQTIIATYEREILSVLKNNNSYLDVIDLKKISISRYIKSNFEEKN